MAAMDSISPNTGSVLFSQTLIDLRGKTHAIGLCIKLSFTADSMGSFGCPDGWGLEISSLVPGKSLTCQGRTYIIDFDWSDETGWQSGLRYLNHHGMKLEFIFPALPLPSGHPGFYAWKLHMSDGALEFFDEFGRLIEHDDVHGNSIYYVYVDDIGGSPRSQLLHIVDSWNQIIRFHYDLDSTMTVTGPDGSITSVGFSPDGVETIRDTTNALTQFTYVNIGKRVVLDTILFSSGLHSKFEYISLIAFDQHGNEFVIPACQYHRQYDTTGRLLRNTQIAYGEETGGATFTAAVIGCRMNSLNDSLMESGRRDYEYDVSISCLDAKGSILQKSRVWYNYLHLAKKEEHYLLDPSGSVTGGFRTLNTYDIPADRHARKTNYTHPIRAEHYQFNSLRDVSQPMHRASAQFNNFGCPLETTQEMWDPTSEKYITQMSAKYTYHEGLSWGGQMLKTEIYLDHVSRQQRQLSHVLTTDQRNIAHSTITYRSFPIDEWRPWKSKSITYDEHGRVLSELVSWTPGAKDYPAGSISKHVTHKTYSFDAGILVESVTNPLGHTGRLLYDMRVRGGPMIQKTSPIGAVEIFRFDALGRLVESSDAVGKTSKILYTINPRQNSVQAIKAHGYEVTYVHDVLGRLVCCFDNAGGDSEGSVSRKLVQREYDEVSRIIKSTNELGLSSSYCHDTLNRISSVTDVHGNVFTYEHDDPILCTRTRVNGDLRQELFTDGQGRPTITINHGDSTSQSESEYHLRVAKVYDGSDSVTRVTLYEDSTSSGSSTSSTLGVTDTVYDIERRPVYATNAGVSGPGPSNDSDIVTRTVTYDIFGNAVTYNKTVKYADGRQYAHAGPLSLYDACGQLVQLTNQAGQVETYEYDRDGHLLAMTRYDGTRTTYTYDLLGRLIATIAPDESTTREYTLSDRVSRIVRGASNLSYEYSLDGSLTAVIYPDGRKQTYTLDRYSRIVEERDAAGQATYNTYDAYGRLSSKESRLHRIDHLFGESNHTKGVHIGDKVTGPVSYHRSILYDGYGRRSCVAHRGVDGSLLYMSEYGRDSRGRLRTYKIQSTLSGVERQRAYVYDGLGQLISDHGIDKDATNSDFTTWQYDGNYNIIRRSLAVSSSLFTYNSLDQRNDAGFVYDRNGRLIQDSDGRRYAYSSTDRLLSVVQMDGLPRTEYEYYPDDSLSTVLTSDSHSQYYRNGGAVNVAYDTRSGQTSWTSYLLEPGHRLAAEQSDGQSQIYVESQNSLALSLSDDGAFITHTHEPYGRSNPTGAGFGWQQEYRTPDASLTYLRSRFYQAEYASFLTMDSARDQENRYAYCNGDPVNLSDGTGHDAQSNGAIWGSIVGIGVTLLSGWMLVEAGPALWGASSMTTVGASAATISGAAGAVSGDSTSALIQGESFNLARVGEDLLVGGIGGAIGAGSGGLSGQVVLRMGRARGLSAATIRRLGHLTSGVIGGGSGSLASAETSAVIHGKSLASVGTALSALIGAAAGLGGALTSAGLALTRKDCLPIDLTLTEALGPNSIIERAPIEALPKTAYTCPKSEYIAEADFAVHKLNMDEADFWTCLEGVNGRRCPTVVTHGSGNRLWVPVKYRGSVITQSIKVEVYADYLRGLGLLEQWIDVRPIKLISCYAGYSNAQAMADALQVPVYAAKGAISVFHDKWDLYSPR